MTSALDEVFGPKEPPPDLGPRGTPDERLLAALQGGTEWHCEDRIRPTLDAFMECWPNLEPHSPVLRRSHYPASRAVVEELGELEAPAFIRWASTVVQQEAPQVAANVKTARSLMFLLGRWRARESGPEWWRKPCPKCSTIHAPGTCPEDLEGEDD
jgi:hypothetical protein